MGQSGLVVAQPGHGSGFTLEPWIKQSVRWSGRRLHLRHAFRRLLGLHAIPRSAGLLRRILRSALGLQSLGMKDAIAPKAAVRQRLRIVLESIRRRFGSGVIHWEQLILLDQHELNMGAGAFDRAWLDVPRYPQALRVNPVPHLVQLTDGDVVTLAVLHPGICQVAEQEKDYERGPTEFGIRFSLAGHDQHHRAVYRSPPTLRDTAAGIKIPDFDVVRPL